MTKENFEKALEFLFPSEGGYVNNKHDRGGPTNMGITQSTLNSYRKRKGLPYKDVKNITREEAKAIYYDDYWKVSGADKILDPNMAVAMFDTAVLHGPGTAKIFYNQSNGDLNKFLDIRQNSYNKIVANNPEQKIFYNGWNNRVNNLRNSINNNKFADNNTVPVTNTTPAIITNPTETYTYDFDKLYKLQIEQKDYSKAFADIPFADPVKTHIFTPSEIGNMSREEFEKNLPIIEQQLKDGLIKPQSEQPKDYTNFKNPQTGTDKIYTREDISKMTADEYSKNEQEIMAQMNSIGIPFKKDLPSNTKTHEKEKNYPTSSTNADGKWVTINGNHVLIKD